MRMRDPAEAKRVYAPPRARAVLVRLCCASKLAPLVDRRLGSLQALVRSPLDQRAHLTQPRPRSALNGDMFDGSEVDRCE